MGLELRWPKLDYRQFQRLCLHMARVFHPGQVFEEYVKQGDEQFGIDIRNMPQSGERDIYIQCKNEKGLRTEGKLEGALQAYLTKKFALPGSLFILMTSADLQTPALQNWIDRRKKEVLANHQIDFICQDVHVVEEELTRHWRIVDQFFGRAEADRVCLKDLHLDIVDRLKPVPDPIPRRVVRRPESSAIGQRTLEEMFWSAATAPRLHLTNLFTGDIPEPQHLWLLGDPYQGKTTYLQQVAFELAASGRRIKPVVIDLKSYNVGAVETLLEDECGAGWRDIPGMDMVLVIEGLDEAPAGEFIKMMKYIAPFARRTNASIIVSCRSLFYEDYSARDVLGDFQVYELCSLQGDDIELYLQRRFPGQVKKFMQAAEKNGLLGWLSHPFYLVTLAAVFKDDKKLPESSLQTVETFIERAFEKARGRQLDRGALVMQKYSQFQEAIKKFAMALQLAGKNAFTQTEIDQVFPQTEEKELLRVNPMVTQNRGSWSFTNTFLQEHLAATYLAAMPFDKIVGLITKSPRIRKVRTKWIQTVSSTLAMLNQGSELFEQLVTLIKEDTPELIFQTERAIFPASFRLDALKLLMVYLVDNDMWPLLVSPQEVGHFVSDVPAAAGYLSSYISLDNSPPNKKVLFCRILQHVVVPEPEKTKICLLVVDQLASPIELSYAEALIGLLAAHRIGDRDTVTAIMALPNLHENHSFRNVMYEWIARLNLVSEFWSYGMAGIAILLADNRTRSGGPVYGIQMFLQRFSSVEHAAQLLEILETQGMLGFGQFKGIGEIGFYQQIFNRCAELFENGGKGKDGRVLVPVSRFIKAIGKHDLRTKYPEIDAFLERTGTHGAITMLLSKYLLGNGYWEPGAIVPKSVFDMLLAEFDEGDYVPALLRRTGRALYPNTPALKAEWDALSNAATGGEAFPAIAAARHGKDDQAEKQRQANDVKNARTRRTFQNAIKKYFQLQGKKTLELRDLYEYVANSPIHMAGTRLVILFIRQIIQHDGTATLNNCMHQLENEQVFEYFRATELFKNFPQGGASGKAAEAMLRTYYYKSLPLCQFENAIYQVGDIVVNRQMEVLVVALFQQFEFPTDEKYLVEMTWLARSGIPESHNYKHSQTGGLFDQIEHQLEVAGIGTNTLRGAILSHLRTGVRAEVVMLSHFYFCHRLDVTAATPFLLDALVHKKVASHDMEGVCEIYLALGGDKAELLVVLDFCESSEPLYKFLLKELGDEWAEKVTTRCLADLADTALTDKAKLPAAEWLTNAGRVEGFAFLVRIFLSQPDHFTHVSREKLLSKISTAEALRLLRAVRFVLVDPEYDKATPPHSAKMNLTDWLFTLAAKGEDDLLQVQAYLQDAEKDLLPTFPGAKGFRWYQFRLLENARRSEEITLPISEVKKILKTIEIE